VNLRIYGITYGDKKTEFIEYRNCATANLHRFEYNPMIDIVDNLVNDMAGADYLGIFSWKFRQKGGLAQSQIVQRMSRAPGADVYNLSPFLGINIGGCGCFMDWSAHPLGHREELRSLIKECCAHTGLSYENNPEHIVYANQFIMKLDLYRAYINRVIKPCMQLLEGPLWQRANVPANYSAGVDLVELHHHTGLRFYNYVPFVLERMAMQFIYTNKLKTIALV
jgi:hypothetical protein